MALHLVRRLAGDEVARRIQLLIEYEPEPPLGGIDWTTVDPASVRPWVRQVAEAGLGGSPELLARLIA